MPDSDPTRPSVPKTSAPTRLTPVQVNAKAIFVAGVVSWLAGLAVLGVLYLVDLAPPSRYISVCIAGVVLGSIGYAWAHRKHLIDDAGMSEEQ